MKLGAALKPAPLIAGGVEGISVTPLHVVDGDTLVVRINRIAARDHQATSAGVRFTPSEQDPTQGSLMITKGHERIELRPGVQIRVRLRGIDAPELQQEGGPEAKAALTRLLFRQRAEDAQSSVRTPPGMGGTAQMWVEDVDRYARLVVLLWTHDASDISGAMVRLGHAWVYDKYSVVPNTYYLTEQEARDAKLGLWSAAAAEPVAPWEWRRQRRIVKGLACDRCGEQLAEWYSDGALEQYCAECVHM